MKKLLLKSLGVATVLLVAASIGVWALFAFCPNMRLTHEIRDEWRDFTEDIQEDWQEFKSLFSNAS